MHNIKIALTLSGRCNLFDVIYKNHLEEIIKRYNIDVFAHTWSDTLPENIEIISNIRNLKSFKITNSQEDLITNEKISLVNNMCTRPEFYTNLVKMTSSWRYVIEELENYEKIKNIKYDVVLKFRFDGCVLTTSGNLQFLDFDENEVIMPDRGVCVENQIIGYKTGIGHNVKIENKNYIIGDCFFYGSHSSRLLHKIYYSLENLINKNKTCLPESIVGHFLIDNGIKIKNQKIIDFIIRKKINPLEMTNELNYLIKNNVTKFCVPDPAKNNVTKKDKNVSIKSRPYVFSDALNVKRQV